MTRHSRHVWCEICWSRCNISRLALLGVVAGQRICRGLRRWQHWVQDQLRRERRRLLVRQRRSTACLFRVLHLCFVRSYHGSPPKERSGARRAGEGRALAAAPVGPPPSEMPSVFTVRSGKVQFLSSSGFWSLESQGLPMKPLLLARHRCAFNKEDQIISWFILFLLVPCCF